MLQLEVNTYGEKAVSLQLNLAARRCTDFREFFEKTGSRITYQSTAANIRAGGRPPWKPWAKSTAVNAAYNKKWGRKDKGKLLVRTGALRDSLKKGDKYNVINIDKMEMQMYSKLKTRRGHYLAEIHQKGAKFTRPAFSRTSKSLFGPMHFFTATGQEVFTMSYKAAQITIPARRMYLLQQAEIAKMMNGIRRHIVQGEGYNLGFRS